MLRVAYGSASWLILPLGMAILMAGVGPSIGAPWLIQLSAVPFFLFLAFWFFYRDPERRVADGIVSPADGKVVRIDTIDDPDLGACDRIAIFMSPLVVHVNRFPLAGDVRSVTHVPGKHIPAFNKDSERNERVITRLRTGLGDVKVIQIAGAVARRIVPYSKPGDSVKSGERLGLVRLGSRCDVVVPQGQVEWTVEVGQKVLAGSVQIARPRAALGGPHGVDHPGRSPGDRAPAGTPPATVGPPGDPAAPGGEA